MGVNTTIAKRLLLLFAVGGKQIVCKVVIVELVVSDGDTAAFFKLFEGLIGCNGFIKGNKCFGGGRSD